MVRRGGCGYNQGMQTAVKHELLVRYLDSGAPTMLHSSKAVTYAEGYADAPDSTAVAALRVFGEFADLLAGRRLSMVLIGADPRRLDALTARLAVLHKELGAPPWLDVRAVPGTCEEQLVPALTESRALTAPLLVYLNAVGAQPPSIELLSAIAAGRSSEVLVALDPVDPGGRRELMKRSGFGFVAEVELVGDDGSGELLLFGTSSDKHLDKFKDTLWAVDEFAGVRYRDPRDSEHSLLDISLSPHLIPLRRALVERLSRGDEYTVAELRRYARDETIYRSTDAVRALGSMLSAGILGRRPDRGRLTAETSIRLTEHAR